MLCQSSWRGWPNSVAEFTNNNGDDRQTATNEHPTSSSPPSSKFKRRKYSVHTCQTQFQSSTDLQRGSSRQSSGCGLSSGPRVCTAPLTHREMPWTLCNPQHPTRLKRYVHPRSCVHQGRHPREVKIATPLPISMPGFAGAKRGGGSSPTSAFRPSGSRWGLSGLISRLVALLSFFGDTCRSLRLSILVYLLRESRR